MIDLGLHEEGRRVGPVEGRDGDVAAAMNKSSGVDSRKWAWPGDAGGSDVAEGIVGSGVKRCRGRGGLPLAIGGTWGLMVAGDVSGIHNLKGSDGAAHVGVGARVDGISDADIGYHGLGMARSRYGLGRDGNHLRDIELVGSLQSSGLHVQLKGMVGRMLEAERNRIAGEQSVLQDEPEVSRSFGAGGGGGDAVGSGDRDICYWQLLLGVVAALDDCSFNRDRSPHFDRLQAVGAQEQPNDYGCRNSEDRPDNFLCRHCAPIDSWTRRAGAHAARRLILPGASVHLIMK